MTARVVLCSQNLPVPDDPRVWREARTLAGAGYAVSSISPGGRGRPWREVLEGVEILRYPTPPDLDGVAGQVLETANALFWTALWSMWLLLRRGRITVVHAANPPDTFFLVALLLRPFGTRFVFDQHDACPELAAVRAPASSGFVRVLTWLERASYRTAHLVIAPNSSYRQLALRRGKVADDAVVVVRSGPDASPSPARLESSRESSPEPQPLVAAFAGVMGRQDGVDVLVDAVAHVLGRHPGALVCDLIGDGSAVPELRARAEQLGIADAVRFPGWLRGETFRRRLASADVGVSPDSDDAFTRVSTMTKVGDYLGVGLPAVVADLPENRVTAGDAALYFTPGDALDLARALEELLASPDRRAELRARAVARAPALTWEHGGRRLVAAYEWLLGKGEAVPGEQVVDEVRKTAP